MAYGNQRQGKGNYGSAGKGKGYQSPTAGKKAEGDSNDERLFRMKTNEWGNFCVVDEYVINQLKRIIEAGPDVHALTTTQFPDGMVFYLKPWESTDKKQA